MLISMPHLTQQQRSTRYDCRKIIKSNNSNFFTESMEVTGLQALWDLFEAVGLPRNPMTQTTLTQPWIKTIAKARRYLSLDLLIGVGVLSSLKNSSINQLIVTIPGEEQALPGYI